MQLHSYLKDITNKYSTPHYELKSQKILFKKLIFLYSGWIVFYSLFILISGPMYRILIVSGLAFINFLLAINLGHDALHRKVFKYSLLQFLSKHTFTICGIDVVFWKISHDIHHSNPNIEGIDTDIETRNIPFLRLYRTSLNNHSIRYQHLYFPLLYLFTSLWWFSLKDLSAAIADIRRTRSSFIKFSFLILRKLFHLFIFLVVPILCGRGILMSLLFFIIIHFVQGLSMALLFQVTHVNDRVAVVPVYDVDHDYFAGIEHQLNTTSNFNASPWIGFFLGGLNHQIEHHLFPGIPHTWYPEISKKIKPHLVENNLNYIEFNSYIQALKSHYFQLKFIGNCG
jgi:linoleoyl-CoA desaturase